MADYHDYGRPIVVSHDYGYAYASGLWLPKAVGVNGSVQVSGITSSPNGGIQIEGILGGIPAPVSGTVVVNQGAVGSAAWLVQPIGGIIEAGLFELIDKDDTEVSLNDYSKSVEVPLAAPCSGEIVQVVLITSEVGAGAVKTPIGVLYFFSSDPTIAAGDAAISLAERNTLIGQVNIGAVWDADTNGASITVPCSIHFHQLSSLFLSFKNLGTAFNDVAGDDEEMSVNFHYVRAS